MIASQAKVPQGDPEALMNLERLGSLHANRLSFMRVLLRTMVQQNWRVSHDLFDLDRNGFGTVVYAIETPSQRYSLVVFSSYLPDDKRNDRVIADQWDLTIALSEGEIDDTLMNHLRQHVPLQEAGRLNSRVLVLSRANRSSRNFERVVQSLTRGHQPTVEQLKAVGYLYRTTAVYGSGKMGMADWDKVRTRFDDLARPFTAEMLTCYLLRQFSIEQVQHIAREQSPASAVPLTADIKRYIGIGNATGLGMAPYLIKHPQLIDRWVSARDAALQRVLAQPPLNREKRQRLLRDLSRAARHVEEIRIEDSRQSALNHRTVEELHVLTAWLAEHRTPVLPGQLFAHVQKTYSFETQEILASLLLELFPALVDDLADQMSVDEQLHIDPAMDTETLLEAIERRYRWALELDFSAPGAQGVFWYRSAEKMEPRLGESGIDPGMERQMRMGIARSVQECAEALRNDSANNPGSSVARFLLRHPQQRPIVKRIQGMARAQCGEIRANLVDGQVLPLHLLRCKLAFFGVSKFDPKSRLWVRNTMFQGAPPLEELGDDNSDDWYFPLAPGAPAPT